MLLKIPTSFNLGDRKNTFDAMMSIEGELLRSKENRKTIRFVCDNKVYFIKQHFGVGWREIFKNLFFLRFPVIGAQNEWRAIARLNELHVLTMSLVGCGRRGLNPARQESFVVTGELQNVISLEDFCCDNRLDFSFKRQLIQRLAEIARTLHENGVNHRDFYLCHFLMDRSVLPDIKLYLIDLHRVQLRSKTPLRWRIKDISGLYFSAMDFGLTRRDIFRFLSIYFNQSWRDVLKCHSKFLRQVQKRAVKLYAKHNHN